MHVKNLVESTLWMTFRLGAVVFLTPQFLLPGVFIFIVGSWLGHVFLKSQMSVKREMSNAKAPVLGHFGAAITGLSRRFAQSRLFFVLICSIDSLDTCLWCPGRFPGGIVHTH